jgi:hypothetical protein
MTDPATFYQQTYRNLLILRERETTYGRPARVPLKLLDQIEKHEKALYLTRQYLDRLISEDNWREAVKLLALDVSSVEPADEKSAADTPVDNGIKEGVPLIETGYNLSNIRQLLTKGFSDMELRSFCFDQPEFQGVYDQLAQDTGKEEIVSLIIEHADQHLLFDLLLAWAREGNPTRYARHQPYINIPGDTNQ